MEKRARASSTSWSSSLPEPDRIRLLLISYLFPPSGGIAVQRALSLAKHLPSCGFDVHVLSARNAAGPVTDHGLLERVPPSVTLHTAFTPEIPFHLRQKIWRLLGSGRSGPGTSAPQPATGGGLKGVLKSAARRLLCPEPEILWVPFAVRSSREIIRRAGIQAVLITAPPFSAFVAGTRLKREFPHLKLVADFRDEWLEFYLNEFDFQNSPHTRKRAAEIERETVEASDLVVAVTETSLAAIRKRYPAQPDAKFSLIHNGYDQDVIRPSELPRRKDGKVVVVHLGTVYKTASPQYYLDAVDELPEDLRSRFETRFIGHISDDQRGVLQNRRSEIRTLGFLPQAEAVKHVADADFVLLTMTNDISLPGKLFEYLALGRPILALASKRSEVNRILSETGCGLCADFRDSEDIRSILKQMASGAGWTLNPKWDAIRKFERGRLTQVYGDRIRNLF
jgi:glycosyltransferase involved in cell wall biosynthesis